MVLITVEIAAHSSRHCQSIHVTGLFKTSCRGRGVKVKLRVQISMIKRAATKKQLEDVCRCEERGVDTRPTEESSKARLVLLWWCPVCLSSYEQSREAAAPRITINCFHVFLFMCTVLIFVVIFKKHFFGNMKRYYTIVVLWLCKEV